MNSTSVPRVVVEATTAEHARGGIGVVVAGLMSAISERALPGVKFWLGPTTAAPEGLEVRRIRMAGSSSGRMLFQRLLLPGTSAARDRASRVLFMDSYVPLWGLGGLREHSSVFVHDVLPLSHPHLFSRRRDLFKRFGYRAIRSARPDVVTSCAFTATEAEQVLGVRPRLATFGCGQLTDAEADRFLQRPTGVRRPFVLYVGNLDRRKGVPTLIEAVARAAQISDPGLMLAVVGNWRSPDGLELRRSLRGGKAPVRFLGRRPKAEVLTLIRRARALVYPAEAEGFGLPVLEGLATSTPVIASDLPVIRSWAGDTVAYAPPGDVEAFADQILEASSGEAERRSRRGLELAAGYRWGRFAEELMAPLCH